MTRLGWPVWMGIAVSALLLGYGLLFFVQTKDPMVLFFALVPVSLAWLVVLGIHLHRRGIPVRIVSDESRR